MRLLNTSTLSLHEFVGDNIPSYAILSHRWEGEEVTFQDMQSGRGPKMTGYSKIRGCCAQAALDGYDYAWIDSCCIDKTSSSELSEAINSMFNWYRKAEVCYAYLSDIPAGEVGEDHTRKGSHFRASEWFTRGWTLQELLAPQFVVFFDRAWVDIGTKSSLQSLVSAITGVSDLDKFERASVAQKMSWASYRRTTRIEDQAYCLMGLFGVNMPPLYGEGRKAFFRLQLEILKVSDDESLFAWTAQGSYGDDYGEGMLALSPTAFSDCGNVASSVINLFRSEFTMTNKGLRMELEKGVDAGGGTLLAPLNCYLRGNKTLGVWLMRVYEDRFFRIPSQSHITLDETKESEGNRTVVYVANPHPGPVSIKYTPKSYTFEFTTGNLREHGFGFPGTLFIGKPNYAQVPVDGTEDVKFSLKEVKHWGLEQMVRIPKYVTFLLKEKAWTKSWKKGFTICLGVAERAGCPTSILVPISPTSVDRWRGAGRVSATLNSGMSVNVAVKERAEGLEHKCVVDVNIDPEGKLRWHSTKSEGLDLKMFGLSWIQENFYEETDRP